MHLGKLAVTVLDATGAPAEATIAVYRQGSDINQTQAGPTYSVHDVGALKVDDTVRLVTPAGVVGTTDYTVTAMNFQSRTVTLSPAPGSLTDFTRIVPQNNQPSLYMDAWATAVGILDNTTDANGRWEAYARVGLYDIKQTVGSDIKLFADVEATSSGPNYYVNAADPRYGITFSGSDDYEGLNKAILDATIMVAEHGNATVVVLPRAGLQVGSQIQLRTGVELRGASQTGSILSAHSSFPSSTALVRFGSSPGSLVNNARLRNLHLDTNNVAGSIGLDLTDASNGCVVENVRLSNAAADGIYVGANASSSLYRVSNVRVTMGTSAGAGSNGINFDGCAVQGAWSNIRIDGGATMGIGIKCNHASGSGVMIQGAHILNSTIGMRVMQGGVSGSHIIGDSTTPTLVTLDAAVGGGSVFLSQVLPKGSATTLNDLIHSATTAGDVTLFVNQTSGVFTNVPGVPWTISSVVNFDGAVDFDAAAVFDSTITANGTVTANGAVTTNSTLTAAGTVTSNGRFLFGTRADVTSATTVALPATGNYFRITGTTNVDTITATVSGHLIMVEGNASSVTVRDASVSGGNLKLDGGTNKTLAANDPLILMCNGTQWIQLAGRSDNGA